MQYEVKDITLADQGLKNIEWAEKQTHSSTSVQHSEVK